MPRERNVSEREERGREREREMRWLVVEVLTFKSNKSFNLSCLMDGEREIYRELTVVAYEI